ncbi:hypothetical protein M8J75_008299 [Diaphorina citri]|nr:hypothetical protein M8J75_008299 [Diaphorina citri]
MRGVSHDNRSRCKFESKFSNFFLAQSVPHLGNCLETGGDVGANGLPLVGVMILPRLVRVSASSAVKSTRGMCFSFRSLHTLLCKSQALMMERSIYGMSIDQTGTPNQLDHQLMVPLFGSPQRTIKQKNVYSKREEDGTSQQDYDQVDGGLQVVQKV